MTGSAVVTGAASGIGRETARDLLGAGWTVFGLDQTINGMSGLDAGGDRFRPVICDLRNAEAVSAALAEVGSRTETVNALVACAGVLRIGPLADMPVEAFDLVFDVNVRGLWLSVRETLPLLRVAAARGEAARIVLLSSIAALRPKVDSGAYAASKAAVSQMTRVLAVECAGSGILVNAIAPGTVDTPMIRDQGDPAASGRWRPSGPSPIGRIAEPDDIVRVIRFLLGPGAAYVNGVTIPVDGGTQAAFVPVP